MDSDTPPIGPGVPPRGSGFSPAPQLQEQLQGLLPQTLGLQDHVVPAVDTEARGLKRKLAGWTAPGDHPTVQQDSKAGIDPSVPVLYDADVKPSVLDVALPQSMVKSEQSPPPLTSSDLPAPVEQQPTIRYARLGTRLPGSGDLGGPGIQKRVWPRLSGVHLDVVWKGQAPEPAVNGNDGPSGTKNQGQDDEVVLEEECYSWTDLPMNKQGFRYIPCGPSPVNSPSSSHPFYRRIPALCMPFGKSEDMPHSPASSTLESPPVHLDWLDRSTYLKVSPSALTCTTEKGFRSVRANVSVRKGAWYFECLVLKGGGEGKSAVGVVEGETTLARRKGTGPVSERFGLGLGKRLDINETGGTVTSTATSSTENGPSTNHVSHTQNPIPTSATSSSSSDGAHVRIGWGRREAPLNGPCGLDAYSYGIRDVTGEKVTLSRPKAYAELGGKAGFGTGDVVGCLIYLPDQDEAGEEQQQQVGLTANGGKGTKVRKGSNVKDEFDPSWVRRKRIPIRYKGQLYFESVEYTVPKEMESLVARDGRPVEPPIDTDSGAAAKGGGTQGKRSLSDSPIKSKAASKGKSKGKQQAGKAVRKKSGGGGSRRKHIDEDDSDQDQTPKPRELPCIRGSKISFFLNGKPMAPRPAFEDIFSFLPLRQTDAELATKAALSKKLGALEASLRDRENPNDDGTLGYYPFISCYGGGKVQFHPGPEWMAPVDPMSWNLGYHLGKDGFQEPVIPRPLSERWQEFAEEEVVYDELDEKEVVELLRKERQPEATKKRVKEEKTAGGSKGSKASVAKKATMAAALQASTPVSRASSAVPSMNGSIPASSNGPSALLATIIQDRGTPGTTPAPATPVDVQFDQTQLEYSHSSPPRTATSVSSPAPVPALIAPESDMPNSYTGHQREQTAVSATSEDAPGEEDWTGEPITTGPPFVDDDAPELPYGVESPPLLPSGVGQIQERAVGY